MIKKILLVDDDAELVAQVHQILIAEGYQVSRAYNPSEAMASLIDRFDLIICDTWLLEVNQSELLTRMREIQPHARVIALTQYIDRLAPVRLLQAGVMQYLMKPVFARELLLMVRNAYRSVAGSSFPDWSDPSVLGVNEAGYLVGESRTVHELNRLLELSANYDDHLMLHTPTGMPAGLMASIIHRKSSRRHKPFAIVNCTDFASELVLSEFLGHEKGAFSGAFATKEGVFELCQGGTVFIDGVSNLNNEAQLVLMKIMNEKTFKRIGNTIENTFDIRLMIAYDEHMAQQGHLRKLRSDFHHVMNTFNLRIPPLHTWGNDILHYAKKFLQAYNHRNNKNVQKFSADTEALLLHDNWPGNFYELEKLVNRAAELTNGHEVQIISFPTEILFNTQFAELRPVLHGVNRPAYGAPAELPSTSSPKLSLKHAAAEAEMETIKRVLKEVRFNKTKAAQVLGIDRKTLYNKIKSYGRRDNGNSEEQRRA